MIYNSVILSGIKLVDELEINDDLWLLVKPNADKSKDYYLLADDQAYELHGHRHVAEMICCGPPRFE